MILSQAETQLLRRMLSEITSLTLLTPDDLIALGTEAKLFNPTAFAEKCRELGIGIQPIPDETREA